jgi:GT2 family glycosyltransferase
VLGSLAAQTRAPAEVLVVDDGSTDGSLALLAADHPGVSVLALGANRGFAVAANAGIRAARGAAIALVNTDIVLAPDWLERAAAALRAAPQSAAVATKLVDLADPTLLYDAGDVLRRDGACEQRGRFERDAGRYDAPGEVFSACAGAALYRRDAFLALGGFDERLGAYLEDVDLGLRLRALGWEAAEAPAARAVHLGGATAGVDSPLQRDLAGFARGFLLRRYGVLRSRAAPRALAIEALVMGWGLVRHRTLVPLRARGRGWRAAGRSGSRALPAGAVDPTIGFLESIRRLRSAR